MARLLTQREICERALRKIGSYSISDTGARGPELEEANRWLDLVIGHVTSIRRTFWMIEETETMTVTAGQEAYLLRTAMASGPRVQSLVTIKRVDLVSGHRTEIPLARRLEWEERDGTITDGEPQMAFYDRTRDPTLHIYPPPPDPVTYSVDVVFHGLSPNLVSGNVNASLDAWRDNWNLYLITALAAELADGPIRKAPGDEVKALRADAKRLYEELVDYDGGERADEPRRVAYNDF